MERWKMWVGHERLVTTFAALESVELHKVALGTLLIDTIHLYFVCRLYNTPSNDDMLGDHLRSSKIPHHKPRNKASSLIKVPR